MTAEREEMTPSDLQLELRQYRDNNPIVAPVVQRWIDAIAHLSGAAEPVYQVRASWRHDFVDVNEAAFRTTAAEHRRILYTHPPEPVCTCPSGDGSLRWPCSRHPPEPARDAKRYQWLRDNPEHPNVPYFGDGRWYIPYQVSGAGGLGGGVGVRAFDTLDAAIDAAMAQESGDVIGDES